MPSMLEAAAGAFSCPAIAKLRGLASSDLPRGQKRRAAYEAVAELCAFMDAQFSSSAFRLVLRAARMSHPGLPGPEQWLAGWSRVKAKMGSDPEYVADLCDTLPVVLARYNALNGFGVFGDPDIQRLAGRGLS